MPIRFRCPSCSGLLSIARRKAGSNVACPSCGADTAVPHHDDPALAGQGIREPAAVAARDHAGSAANGSRHSEEGPPSMPLFERPDFEKLIDPKAKPTEVVTTPPQAGASPLAHPLIESEGGFYVSRGSVVVLAVMMVVLVALAFATGFLIGS